MQLPFVIRAMGYAGLIPFVGLALSVQFADSPNDLIALESLVAYGAVIASFLGALHWGACFRTIGQNSHNRWLDHSVWIWGIIPALVSWLAIHIYIPLALLLLAITLIVQRLIDQNTIRITLPMRRLRMLSSGCAPTLRWWHRSVYRGRVWLPYWGTTNWLSVSCALRQ